VGYRPLHDVTLGDSDDLIVILGTHGSEPDRAGMVWNPFALNCNISLDGRQFRTDE